MGCPTFLNPPWQVPGWDPNNQAPGVSPINLTGSGVPNGATVAFLALSVNGSPGQAASATDSSASVHSNRVRVQVSGVYNDGLAFAPIFYDSSGTPWIYIDNDSLSNLDVWVRVVGYN